MQVPYQLCYSVHRQEVHKLYIEKSLCQQLVNSILFKLSRAMYQLHTYFACLLEKGVPFAVLFW